MIERAPMLGLVLLLAGGCGASPLDAVNPAIFTASPTYAHDIAPLLRESCVPCHASNGVLAGGVELDRYDSAYSGRVRNACVAVREELVAEFAEVLMPTPRDPPVAQSPCNGWVPFSMPTGAASPLSASDQVLLLRWVELGGPP